MDRGRHPHYPHSYSSVIIGWNDRMRSFYHKMMINQKLAAVRRDLRGGLLHHHLIGEFICVAWCYGKVSGKQFTGLFDGLTKGIAGPAVPDPLGDGLCKPVQRLLIDLFIDPSVGKDPDLVF